MKPPRTSFLPGFSLIEVLVTLLLISIALLGMAALQGRASAYSQQSLQRSTAAMLANDLLEQARTAPGQWSRYLRSGAPPPPSASCRHTPSQPAAQLGCWLGEVTALLPAADALAGGGAYICLSPAANVCAAQGSAIEIQVAWKASQRECGNEPQCRYRLRSEI